MNIEQGMIFSHNSFERAGIEDVLVRGHENIQINILWSGNNAIEAVEQLAYHLPKLMIVSFSDISPDNAIAVTSRAKELGTSPIALLNPASPREVTKAAMAGADSLLEVSGDRSQLLQAAYLTTQGLSYLDSNVSNVIVGRINRAEKRTVRLNQVNKLDPNALTYRERELVLMLAQGTPTKTIAQELGISKKTIESHLGEIFEKLGVKGRVQTIRTAFKQGIVELV